MEPASQPRIASLDIHRPYDQADLHSQPNLIPLTQWQHPNASPYVTALPALCPTLAGHTHMSSYLLSRVLLPSWMDTLVPALLRSPPQVLLVPFTTSSWSPNSHESISSPHLSSLPWLSFQSRTLRWNEVMVSLLASLPQPLLISAVAIPPALLLEYLTVAPPPQPCLSVAPSGLTGPSSFVHAQ